MLLLNRNKKVTCKNSGAYTKNRFSLVTRKVVLLVITLYPKSQFLHNIPKLSELSFCKEHSAPKPTVTSKCTLCCQKFPGSHALRHHKNTEDSFLIKTKNVELDEIINEVDDKHLRKALHSCQFYAYWQLEKARHKVFKSARRNFNAAIVDEKFEYIFKILCFRFWILFEIYRTWKVQICLRTRK